MSGGWEFIRIQRNDTESIVSRCEVGDSHLIIIFVAKNHSCVVTFAVVAFDVEDVVASGDNEQAIAYSG